MRVSESAVNLSASSSYKKEESVEAYAKSTIMRSPGRTFVGTEAVKVGSPAEGRVGISQEAQIALSALKAKYHKDDAETGNRRLSENSRGAENQNAGRTDVSKEASDLTDTNDSPRLQLLLRLIEAFFGLKIQKPEIKGIPSQEEFNKANQRNDSIAYREYGIREVRSESEHSSFSTQGTIKTADGKELAFSMRLEMNYSFYQETSLGVFHTESVRGKFLDPLTINFAGSSAELTNMRFSFDIDADGQTDEMHFAKGGSCFLVLDKNGDGKINDGAELFGALSGNGFADLAAYDTDKNGWIDENDAVFDKLKLWQKNEKGEDRFLSLKEADVGAIYVGAANTPFTVRKENREARAMIRQTGVFLYESHAAAGSVQQIDLVI